MQLRVSDSEDLTTLIRILCNNDLNVKVGYGLRTKDNYGYFTYIVEILEDGGKE